jgi:hypothetical protein
MGYLPFTDFGGEVKVVKPRLQEEICWFILAGHPLTVDGLLAVHQSETGTIDENSFCAAALANWTDRRRIAV